MAFFTNPLLFKDEVYAITGAAMEVPNTLGNGLNEKVYENALVVECRLRKIPFDQQPRFPVDYKGCRVGEFIPDLILHGKIIVDTKTNQLEDEEDYQDAVTASQQNGPVHSSATVKHELGL
jgi:GxxExxY protein